MSIQEHMPNWIKKTTTTNSGQRAHMGRHHTITPQTAAHLRWLETSAGNSGPEIVLSNNSEDTLNAPQARRMAKVLTQLATALEEHRLEIELLAITQEANLTPALKEMPPPSVRPEHAKSAAPGWAVETTPWEREPNGESYRIHRGPLTAVGRDAKAQIEYWESTDHPDEPATVRIEASDEDLTAQDAFKLGKGLILAALALLAEDDTTRPA